MKRLRRQRPAVPLELPGDGARDAGLRRVLVRQLREAHGCAEVPLVVEEMGLHHGQARADVAALSSVIHGFELKSERDNLRRLPLQVFWYGRVLDRCTLVAAEAHLAHTLAVVPSWWGVKRVHRRGVELVLEQVREARPNPEQQLVDLARLLWREEALEELTARDAAGLWP